MLSIWTKLKFFVWAETQVFMSLVWVRIAAFFIASVLTLGYDGIVMVEGYNLGVTEIFSPNRKDVRLQNTSKSHSKAYHLKIWRLL